MPIVGVLAERLRVRRDSAVSAAFRVKRVILLGDAFFHTVPYCTRSSYPRDAARTARSITLARMRQRHADRRRDWEKLLDACHRNPA